MRSIWILIVALAIFVVSAICLITSIDKNRCVRQTRLAIATLLFIIACALMIAS